MRNEVSFVKVNNCHSLKSTSLMLQSKPKWAPLRRPPSSRKIHAGVEIEWSAAVLTLAVIVPVMLTKKLQPIERELIN